MRPLAAALPIALLTLVTACGTSSQPIDSTTDAPAKVEPTVAAPTTPESTGPAPSGGATAAVAGPVLNAVLEKTAFTIKLTDDKGAPVTTLKAGTYQIKVKDPSVIHNFHLTGPGVDLTTTVPEVKEVTWPVEFKAGSYKFACDPHPNMIGNFTVTT